MKALKVALIAVIAVILILIIGAGIFLKTFDLNKYVPQMASQMSQSLGRNVTIGRADLKFSFSRGISLTVNDLIIADSARFSDQPFLKVSQVFMGVDIKRLFLEHRLLIEEITLKSPEMIIIRSKDGGINAATIGSPGAGASSSENKAQMALPVLLVKDISFVQGRLIFEDRMATSSMKVDIDQLDLKVEGFSLDEAFLVSADWALFSEEQNFHLNVKVTPELRKLGIRMEDLMFEADLSKIDLPQVNKAFPSLMPLDLKALSGKLSFKADHLVVNIAGLTALSSVLSLQDGSILSGLMPLALSGISMKATIAPRDLEINEGVVPVLGGQVQIKGMVKNYVGHPSTDLIFNVADVDIGALSALYKMPVSVKGKLQGAGAVSFVGKTPEEIQSTMNGRMVMELKEGVLEGLNLVQGGLGGIPLLSGLWSMIEAELPPETREDIRKGVTLIQKCVVDARLQGDVISVDKAQVLTRDVTISALGTAQLQKTMNMTADFYLSKTLSELLIKKISDLASLKGPDGLVRVPFLITGPMLKPVVTPDHDYLTQHLLIDRGKSELKKILGNDPKISGLLNSLLGAQSQPSQEEGDAQSGDEQEKDAAEATDQAVGAILDKLFKK